MPKKAPLIASQEEDYERITNKEIVEIYLESGLLRKCLEIQFQKLPVGDRWKRQYMEDMWQDLIVFLMTYNNEKLNNAHHYNHINALVTRILQNQLYSDHSKFYIDYIKFGAKSDDIKDKHLRDDG